MKFSSLHITLLLFVSTSAAAQLPDFSKVPNLYDGDSANITYLVNNGIKISKGKTICWFPKDSLPGDKMKAIADTINTGILAAEKFINAPQSWQSHFFTQPYTFYFRFDTIISHASAAGFVSVSFWRIKSGKAPWLHEAMHEMLDSKTGSWMSKSVSEDEQMKNMPLWLHEGLADYISLQVSRSLNLKWFDIFSRSYSVNTDSLYLADQKSEKAAYIVPYIGAKGIMPELGSKDRINYAPCFYHGSASLVKYIAETYGIKILLTAIASFNQEQEMLEKLTGKKMETLKQEWQTKLDTIKR